MKGHVVLQILLRTVQTLSCNKVRLLLICTCVVYNVFPFVAALQVPFVNHRYGVFRMSGKDKVQA